MRSQDDREVIVLEHDAPSPLKWLLIGAALGAGLALLFAPASGDETRRRLAKQARRVKDMAGDTLDELRNELDAFQETEESDTEGEGEGESKGELGTEEEAVASATSSAGAGGEPAPRRRVEGTGPGVGRRRVGSSAREELERRLAEARARRRESAPEDEEPVA